MARMLEMIRNSQVPANLMQSAARGALSLPPDETIEILVYLALHHKLFGERARLTLAGWDEKASAGVAANPKTTAEVLEYLISPENLRVALLPALAENPSVKEEALDALAVSGSRSILETLMKSARVMSSPRLLQALQTNPNLRPNEAEEIGEKLAASEPNPATEGASANGETAAEPIDEVVEVAVKKFLEENAVELAAEKDKLFQPLEGALEEAGLTSASDAASGDAPKPDALKPDAAKEEAPKAPEAAKPAPAKKPVPGATDRDSALQKISKLGIQGRITLAMRGTKEERAILIRDSTKLVCIAVLDSPKVSDGEVEKFALQKNVLEAVLRGIPMRRKFAKNYVIMRNLVFNPRTPLDLSLSLMKNLLVHDLKNLSGNKEVSETVRKLALRMFKQKIEKKD
jgi:hypothetical protein